MNKSEYYTYENVFRDKKYKLIVLDMDGTLYYQRKMQLLMCREMILFAIGHPGKIWKLRTISEFRKIREAAPKLKDMKSAEVAKTENEEYESLLEVQYQKTADQVGKTKEQVKSVIEEWMFLRPLKYIARCRDIFLCKRIGQWQEEGVKVVVYSDYPAKEKCEALKIAPDAVYSSEEFRIGEMKPSCKGMEVIGQDFSVDIKEMLVVGDRNSKDGTMAENAGSDYLILEKWKWKRSRRYPTHEFK